MAEKRKRGENRRGPPGEKVLSKSPAAGGLMAVNCREKRRKEKKKKKEGKDSSEKISCGKD